MSARSASNPEMAFLPPIVIMLGVVTLLALAGYWLMKPSVFKNPGLAAYRPPTEAVLDYGRGERSAELELAANRVADAENAKLGYRSALVAQTRSADSPDRMTVTASQRKTNTARVDASRQRDPRVAQSNPASFLQRLFGNF